jgi:N-acetyl-anhydromuramyl-L-alanine amidase AmpD
MPVATPAAPPSPASSAQMDASSEEPAELTIEKTGYEKKPGFWYRFFHGEGGKGSSGSGAGYRYLTRAVRAEIDRAPADRRNPRWEFIVVHNSGTRQGNARVFDYYHKHVRHMQNGLAYHFVIGNGTSTGNGQIEIGDRWRRQINGGHVHSDHLNNIALGICLVGDFNRSQPTPAQLQSCEELIRYLRQRCGKIGNHYMVVKPHREMNPPRWATDCPGDAFPYSWFRRFQE